MWYKGYGRFQHGEMLKIYILITQNTHIPVYIHKIYTYTHTHIHVCIHMYTNINMYIICIYIYTHTHTYIYIFSLVNWVKIAIVCIKERRLTATLAIMWDSGELEERKQKTYLVSAHNTRVSISLRFLLLKFTNIQNKGYSTQVKDIK